MNRVAAAALLLASSVAGCAAAPPEPTAASLEEFSRCAFLYPDGTPVPCRDDARSAEATTEIPTLADGWVCQSGQGGYASYHRQDDSSRIGASYPDLPVEGPVHGRFTIESAEATQAIHAWESTPARHFVEVRKETDGPNAGLILYQATVETDHPALAGVQPAFLWTLWQGHPWLVFEFATPSGTYWFQSMVEFRSEAGSSFAPAHLDVQGSDFHLALRLWNSGGYGWGAPSPDAACSLLGPDG